MEGRNKSGNHSGVVKNRSSSGCLIIKKKHHGVSGAGSSKGPKLHESKKEKKRPKLNATDTNSLSSDEEFLEYNRRHGMSGMNRVSGDSLVYESNGFGRNEMMREVGPKRSQLDVYDFDEYDDLSDVEMMSHYHDRGMGSGAGERRFLSPMMPGMHNVSGLDFDGGSSKGDIIYKRRNSFRGGSSSAKVKASGVFSNKRRFEMRNEIPVSMPKDKLVGSDEAIRLQGKNGVLKVRVKHKEEISEHLSQNCRQLKGNNVAPRSQELTAKKTVTHSLPFSEKNLPKPKKPTAINSLDKNHQRKRKSVAAESSEESDEGEDSDSPPKLPADNVQGKQSIKRGRTGGSISMQSPQTAQPVKAKEGKVKRGSGTEKQLLREKIRSMLVSAGWTIDYRPRRGRDYFDAVYVNPTGTAYWSIIKAYDALQKQLEEEGNSIKAGDDCSSFAPISEDVLSKLTRQTRKKIEKELKRKKREEAVGKRKKEFTSGSFEADESDTDTGGTGKHDDKLSSFMKRSSKSVKGASKESCREGSYSSKMQERNEKNSSTSNSLFTHAKRSKKIGRCTLLVRNPKKGPNAESDGFIPYTGKRNLLSWLIDSGTVKLSEKVHYMNRRCTRVMLEGWITREGIHCGCCSKILTVSKFEIHAGSKLRQPYQNIYLSSGASLMQCQVDAWNKQEESLRNGFNNIDVNGDDPNDDTCAICGDGGNLICCDSCPSTFHQNCLGIEMLPAGDWHCPHCSCRFCGLADMSVTEGNNRRLDSVVMCIHCSCVEDIDDTPINSNNSLFCGKTCQELYECLQKLLGVKHELEAGLCWSLIHRTDLGSDNSIRAYPHKVEWNSKLAVALNVMDECFLPITDRRSGINMIHSVLYNSVDAFPNDHNASFMRDLRKQSDQQSSPGLCNDTAEPENKEMKDKCFTHFGSQDIVCADETFLQRTAEFCEEVKPSLDAEGEEMKDKSVTDLGTQVEVCTDEKFLNRASADFCDEVPLPTASPHDSNDNKPSLHDAFAFVSDEIKPLISNEEKRETTSSELLLDTKFNESSDSVKDHFSADASAGNCDIGNSLDDSAARRYAGVSSDAELAQGTNVDVATLVSAPADGSVAATSSNGLLNGFAENDNETQRNGMLFSNVGSATYEKDQSLLEASHSDVMEEPTADVCSCHPPKVEEDDTDVVLDVCSGSQSLLVCDNSDRDGVHGPKLHVFENAAAHGEDHSLWEPFHVDTEMSKPSAEERICRSSEIEVDNADIVQAETNVCSGSQPLQFPDNTNLNTSHEPNIHVLSSDVKCSQITEALKALPRNDHCFSEPFNGDVEMEKPPADNNICHSPEVKVDNSDIDHSGTNVCCGSQSLHFPENTDLDIAHEPNIHAYRNDVECSQITDAREALPADDRTCETLHNASHSTSTVEKPQFDSYGGKTEQPTFEGEVQHVDAVNIQPASKLSCEVIVDTIDPSALISKDTPSISNDVGIGVTSLSRVSELHDPGIN
ncbi:Increased DNA methylation 1 [Bienertia sinuspersici]